MTDLDSRIVDEFNHRAPFRLEDARVFVLARVGSHSHGTYVPPSDPQAIDDVDFMGVVVPPPEYVLGIERWEGVNFQRDELDCVFYSFEKFMRLLVKSNPNVLGLLWLRLDDFVLADPEWGTLLRERMLFSTLEAYHAFIGYAYGQLKRMTAFDAKTTKEWDDAVTMTEAAGWEVNAITDKAAALPMPNYTALNEYRPAHAPLSPESWNMMLTDAKVSIQRIHARHFQGYMGEKRKALVRKYGYDTKNAAHLIRLMRMCNEFLADGELRVYRTTDAWEIRAIKGGEWPLEKAQAEAEMLFTAAKDRKNASPLPDTPDRKTINRLVVGLQREFYDMGKCVRMKRTPILRKSRPKKTNPARRRKEFARTLGSKARQKFVQSLPCSACGVVGYSVNAHLLGNGGMSRKGDYTTVGPLCGPRADATDPWSWAGTTYIGCHKLFDDYQWKFDARFPGFDPEKVAAETELAWRASLGSSPGGHQK